MNASAGEPRRGPKRLGAAEASAFLEQARWGALCWPDPTGRLCATPVRIEGSGAVPGLIGLTRPEAGPAPQSGDPVCLVADEFESYEGIRGVIVQGRAVPGRSGPGDGTGGPAVGLSVAVTATVGFSFAGTLPPSLVDPEV